MAALILKNIEKGSASMGSGDTTLTITLANTLSSTSKTILQFSARISTNSALTMLINGRIISTTQIQFTRSGSPSADADIEYEVSEFTQGITVQHIEVQQTGNTTNTTITSVNTAKAFPLAYYRNSGGTLGTDDFLTCEITTSTNLQTVANGYQVDSYSGVQIIEIDDATVQKVSTTFGTGTTKDITVSSITESATFWFFSMSINVNYNAEQWCYLTYVNSTTLRFNRTMNPGTDHPLIAYVVSVSSGVTVQNISTTISAGNVTATPSLTSVNFNNMVLSLCGPYGRFTSVAVANAVGGQGTVTVGALTATGFTATRNVSTNATNTNVQAIEFTKGAVSWFLLGNKNELVHLHNINGMR